MDCRLEKASVSLSGAINYLREASVTGSALFQSQFSFKTIETWCLYSVVGT